MIVKPRDCIRIVPLLMLVAILASSCSNTSNTSQSSTGGWPSGRGTWTPQESLPSAFGNAEAVSCVSSSSCTVAGGDAQAQVVEWDGGTWGNVRDFSGTTGGGFFGISCSSLSSCTAVGAGPFGPSAPLIAAPMVAIESGGTWSSAVFPSGASPSGFGGGFTSVSCISEAECFAVGDQPSGAVLSQSNQGSWAALSVAPGNVVSLNSVSCAEDGTCQAVGEGPSSQGALISRTNGVWSGGSSNQVPLASISCSAPGYCVAVGGDASGAVAQYEVSGLWSSQVAIPETHGIRLQVVSCFAANALDCVAIGSKGSATEAMSLSWRSSESWSLPVQIGDFGALGVRGVSCSGAWHCMVVGFSGNQNLFEVLH